MPITLRKINAQVKDPNTGEMIPAGILSSDSLTTIAAAENSAITRINNKKTQSLDAITSTGTTQVNAVTAAGTAAAANFPATEEATTTLANDFAPTYVPNQAYNVGDYCTYQYKIYKCKTPIAENTDAAFVTAHWDKIMITDEVGDLKESVYIQSVPTFQWVQGNIKSSNGRDDNTTNYNLRLREQLYIGASNKILVSTIPNGYRIFTYKYSGPIADTYIGKGRDGWDTEAFELDGGYYYRFVVAYSDNSAITPENAPNITITTIDVTDKTLTLASKAADAKATGEMIMINNAATAGTKIRITTTNDDVSLVTTNGQPFVVRKINAQVKDPTTGEMIPAGILSSDSLTTIAAAENSAITRITNAKTSAINEITQLFPAAPTVNGAYNLQCIVNNGVVTYQWTLIT